MKRINSCFYFTHLSVVKNLKKNIDSKTYILD